MSRNCRMPQKRDAVAAGEFRGTEVAENALRPSTPHQIASMGLSDRIIDPERAGGTGPAAPKPAAAVVQTPDEPIVLPSVDRAMAIVAGWERSDMTLFSVHLIALALAKEVRRLRELAAKNEWQPIETAPKDGTLEKLGTPILVWDGRAVGIVAWQVFSKSGTGWWIYMSGPYEAAFGDYDSSPICNEPTHWQPLPLPPKTTEPNA